MRASLLASAIARTLWCKRCAAAAIQGWRPWRAQVAGLSSTTRAAWTKRVRKYLMPRLEILPRMVRSPVEICLGTRPSQAAKSRPLENASPAPIAATIALEMIGPTPGTLIKRSQPASRRARASISLDRRSMRSSSRRQSAARSSSTRTMRGLTNQPLTHTVQSLQVELLGGPGCDELHRRALHRLGDCLGIAEVVLLPPRVGAHIFGWHQPSVVAKRCEFTAQVMCTDDMAAGWRAVLLLGRETTSGVGRSRHANRDPPRETSSCRYRYRSRRLQH